jgi:hypothetical protein
MPRTSTFAVYLSISPAFELLANHFRQVVDSLISHNVSQGSMDGVALCRCAKNVHSLSQEIIVEIDVCATHATSPYTYIKVCVSDYTHHGPGAST